MPKAMARAMTDMPAVGAWISTRWKPLLESTSVAVTLAAGHWHLQFAQPMLL